MALTTRLPSMKVEPFHGFVETTGDALRLIQAARSGIIPRITRRLNDLERRAMIKSGSIFIFSDEESGIKRWTEGLSWSASRIVGNFLVYREVTERVGARASSGDRRIACRRRASSNSADSATAAEQRISKSLIGCLSDTTGRFKASGLVKKTITVCVEGSDHHLIAYYTQEDVRLGRLSPLSSRNDIMSLEIPPELLESTKFRVPPITKEGPDGRPRYVCDADEGDLTQLNTMSFPPASVHTDPASLFNVPRLYIPSEHSVDTTSQASPSRLSQSGSSPCSYVHPHSPTYMQDPHGHNDWFAGPHDSEISPRSSVSSGSSDLTMQYESDHLLILANTSPTRLLSFPTPETSPRNSVGDAQLAPSDFIADMNTMDPNLWGSMPTYEQMRDLFGQHPIKNVMTHHEQDLLTNSFDTAQGLHLSQNTLAHSLPAPTPVLKDFFDTPSLPFGGSADMSTLPAFSFIPHVLMDSPRERYA